MTRILPLTLALLAALGGCAAQRDSFAPAAPGFAQEFPGEQPVSLVVEHPGGEPFQMFPHGSAMYVAGEEGSQYVLRLVNNTAERLEVIVTVDGRDVVSGELGDFKKQRGYVIEPFASVPVEGFRTSLESVAAFRFASLGASYTARRGTPQHVGVIGVAVFREKPSKEKNEPIAVAPRPYFESGRSRAPAGEPFPDSSTQKRSVSADEDAAASAPAESEAAEGGAFAPDSPPTSAAPHHELGTEFGEAQLSSVTQVEFKRQHKRKPDAFLTLYYDTIEGLEARGIVPGSQAIGFGDPDPFPAQAR